MREDVDELNSRKLVINTTTRLTKSVSLLCSPPLFWVNTAQKSIPGLGQWRFGNIYHALGSDSNYHGPSRTPKKSLYYNKKYALAPRRALVCAFNIINKASIRMVLYFLPYEQLAKRCP